MIQRHLFKPTCIGGEILCLNRQSYRLHSAKNIENGQNKNENQSDNMVKRITQVSD